MDSNRFNNTIASIAAALVVAATLLSTGCALPWTRFRANATDERFSIGGTRGANSSPSAARTMLAYEIDGLSRSEQLERLLLKINEEPTAELVYAYVETAYIEARETEKRDPQRALQIYVSAALYAYHLVFNNALNDATERSVFNGDLFDSYMLYNGACERALHLALQNAEATGNFPFIPGRTTTLPCNDCDYPVFCNVVSSEWTNDEVGSFLLTVDCKVDELSYECRHTGIGAPLVVQRRPDSQKVRAEEEYYPYELCFPATALIRPNPTLPLGSLPPIDLTEKPVSEAAAKSAVWLELYDSLKESEIKLHGCDVVLQTDLTTPLAYFLNSKGSFAKNIGTRGMFDPTILTRPIPTNLPTGERTLQGLYMLQPYDPNKIPVVMIHGLGSSPITWLEMYNALCNSKEIQKSYQFWFYFYQTGQPFWISAAELREDLANLRDKVDFGRRAYALDQIVLIGHSMGGLIARMQVQDSGDEIWKRISSTPIDEVDFDADTLEKIRSWFFFKPNPSIRRVITIASPFEGSDYSNHFTQWLADKTISRTDAVTEASEALTYEQLSKVEDPTLLLTTTSVESLAPNCPIFEALDAMQIPDDVALNNIVGILPSLARRCFHPTRSDGVVDFSSSHRNDVESEKAAPAPHVEVHTHPSAIVEVSRILSRHLEYANSDSHIARARVHR